MLSLISEWIFKPRTSTQMLVLIWPWLHLKLRLCGAVAKWNMLICKVIKLKFLLLITGSSQRRIRDILIKKQKCCIQSPTQVKNVRKKMYLKYQKYSFYKKKMFLSVVYFVYNIWLQVCLLIESSYYTCNIIIRF